MTAQADILADGSVILALLNPTGQTLAVGHWDAMEQSPAAEEVPQPEEFRWPPQRQSA
jgi:hypothetical protein